VVAFDHEAIQVDLRPTARTPCLEEFAGALHDLKVDIADRAIAGVEKMAARVEGTTPPFSDVATRFAPLAWKLAMRSIRTQKGYSRRRLEAASANAF